MGGQNTWAQYEEKYTLHEETKELWRFLTVRGSKKYSELGVEKTREQVMNLCLPLNDEIEFNGADTEIIVPSPHTSEGIPVSVYTPASRPEVPAILIYFHGGGLVFCSRKTHETLAKIIARDSGAVVLNVEYRLLPNPDAPYAPFEDAEVVTRWVLENKEVVGGKLNSKVGVGGDSAGGQIAAGVANEVHGLDFQILVCPLTDTSFSQDSVKEFKDVPDLNEDTIKFLFDNSYNHMPDHLTNPRVNVMAGTNTASSPPALIIVAELDPLRDCGVEYAEKLRAAGVKVQLETFQGVPHAFCGYRHIFKTTYPKINDCIVKFLNQFQ
ncbi:hypothetical protein BsWGS_21850 [Bradybaena similaris]